MQRRNQSRSENDENDSKIKNKYWATSTKSFRNKVGSMFSNVFGKKKSREIDSKGENGHEVHSNGDDEEMKKLKNMVERVDMESEKITRKNSEDNVHDGGKQMALATGFGMSAKEMLEDGDEGKEKPKSRRTYSKTLSKRNGLKLIKGKINNVDDSIVDNTDLSVACVGEKGANIFGTKRIVSLKQAENSNDLPGFRSKTLTSHRKLKTAGSIKKMISVQMGGKSEKQELCKKRILMGGKCRPLNHSGIIHYDENGVLLPEIIP
ncbi:hypothetical protein CRYUN_Cryun24cG0107200 [Craigia yunnanensis]